MKPREITLTSRTIRQYVREKLRGFRERQAERDKARFAARRGERRQRAQQGRLFE